MMAKRQGQWATGAATSERILLETLRRAQTTSLGGISESGLVPASSCSDLSSQLLMASRFVGSVITNNGNVETVWLTLRFHQHPWDAAVAGQQASASCHRRPPMP
ncbi:hypothetical protein VTI74DRAFT_11395 [Chaetomium olivicolor]